MCSKNITGIIFILIVLIASPLYAQQENPILINRIHTPIQLDGLSNEEAWKTAEPLSLTQYEPVFGDPPTENSEARIVYDDEYMYFSMRAYDSQPSKIRGNVLYRDYLSNDDRFEVMIDTYNDNETAIVFATNPAGYRMDVEISNDGSGPVGDILNFDYNTYWSAEAITTEQGWFAEIRIPLSTLQFKQRKGRVVMGVSIHRIIARKSERDIFPSIKPNTQNAFLKPSRMQKIELKNIKSQNPIYFVPYALGGMEHKNSSAVEDEENSADRKLIKDVGLDVKYRITNNFTLDATLNTDFAQVEADNQQLNLTRFSLFFPEKRQFFQEQSSLFSFNTGGQSRLFHSRRIGLNEEGEQVRILGGARLVGQSGSWDIGGLNMQTKAQGNLPSENFTVVRLSRQIMNPYSHLGGMVTSRIGMDGRYNLAYGVDGTLRLYGNDYLTFHVAQTFENKVDKSIQFPQNMRFSSVFEKRRRDGVGYKTNLIVAGENYSPGIGFIRRSGFINIQQDLSYTWRYESSPFIWHTLESSGKIYLRNEDKSIESGEARIMWSFAERAGGNGKIEANLEFNDILTPFSIGDEVRILRGEYMNYNGNISYSTTGSRLLRTNITIEGGTFFEGWNYSISVSPNWSISPHFKFQATYIFDNVQIPSRNQELLSHIGRLRFRTPFNTKISLNTFIQYNSTINTLSLNPRFRYNFSEGHDLWVVYNDNLNTTRFNSFRNLPVSRARSIMFKYTHPIKIGTE